MSFYQLRKVEPTCGQEMVIGAQGNVNVTEEFRALIPRDRPAKKPFLNNH